MSLVVDIILRCCYFKINMTARAQSEKTLEDYARGLEIDVAQNSFRYLDFDGSF